MVMQFGSQPTPQGSRKRVVITSTDIASLQCIGQEKGGGSTYMIDLTTMVGGFAINPAIGEEWVITQVQNRWSLERQTSLQNVATTAVQASSQGDVVFNASGKLILAKTDMYFDTGSITKVNGVTAQNVAVAQNLTTQNLIVTGAMTGIGSIPIGSLTLWAGSRASIPAGYLICEGQSLSRTTYSSLFSTIGLTYNPSAGAGVFNIPDIRGRVIIGVNGSDSDFLNQGYTGGTKTVAGGSHSHNISATHAHGISNTHTHTSALHSHTSAAHSHTLGAGYAQVSAGAASGTNFWIGYASVAAWNPSLNGVLSGTPAAGGASQARGANLGGSTDSTTPSNVGNTVPGNTGAASSGNTDLASSGNTDLASPSATSVVQPYISFTYLIKYV